MRYQCFVWHPLLRRYISVGIVSNDWRIACQRNKLWLSFNRGIFIPFFGYHSKAHTGFLK